MGVITKQFIFKRIFGEPDLEQICGVFRRQNRRRTQCGTSRFCRRKSTKRCPKMTAQCRLKYELLSKLPLFIDSTSGSSTPLISRRTFLELRDELCVTKGRPSLPKLGL